MPPTRLLAPASVADEMMQTIIDTICSRPRDTAEQKAVRARDARRYLAAFDPRDPVELMLAGMAVTNFYHIMDSSFEVFSEATDVPRGRINASIVAFERATTVFIREIRIAQKRALHGVAAETQPAAEAEPVTSSSAMPEAEPELVPTASQPAHVPEPSVQDSPPLWHDVAAEAMSAVLCSPAKPGAIDHVTKPAEAMAKMLADVEAEISEQSLAATQTRRAAPG